MITRLTLVRLACMLAVFAVVGCADRAPRSAPATVGRAPATSSQPSPAQTESPSSAPSPVTSARVVVTGALQRRGDEIEICPGAGVEPCAGIRVEGDVDEAWLSERGKVAVWRITGAYDGTTLVVDAPAQPTALANRPDHRNTCPEFQNLMAGGNGDDRVAELVDDIMRGHDARVAGDWWDRERQTIVIWVTGDPTELRRQMAERAPGARVCIQGQARYSQEELDRARLRADRILDERRVIWSISGTNGIRNQVVYQADAIDARTLAQLAHETGEAIHVTAFIELLEQDLERLPVPAVRGDIRLVTELSRAAMSMTALGYFRIQYDPELGCVYLGSADNRILPIWPFGYWATSNPLQIFDYDDNLVARGGERIAFGGGNVPLDHPGTAKSCRARSAWNGQPPAPVQPRAPR